MRRSDSVVSLRIVGGSANRRLATEVAATLCPRLVACELDRFPDGELRPSVGNVRGDDVYVIQSTGPPVNEHLVELLLLLDACRRAGAGTITAVVPYFGYARQDRRGRPGQAVGSRVVADLLASAGADRLVVVDPHTPTLEAMCSIPVEMVTAVPVLAGALQAGLLSNAVVMAPDLGAVKLAERYASLLSRPVAVVRKTRVSGAAVQADELVGDVQDRAAVIVDDMISTGATIEAAAGLARAHGATDEITVVATHGLLVEHADERLAAAGIGRLHVADTVPVSRAHALPVEVHSVAAVLADTISRLHRRGDMTNLLMPT
jgi:ribose-phosphate pyrophosphokinase